jgi:hypothetical protein
MWSCSRTMTMIGLSSSCILWIVPCGVDRSRSFLSRRTMTPSWWTSYLPSSSRPKWTVGCGQRPRTRLTLIVQLLFLDQGLTLTCLRDSSLCLVLSMPDEEFDVLGEEDLVLLIRRFGTRNGRMLGGPQACATHAGSTGTLSLIARKPWR